MPKKGPPGPRPAPDDRSNRSINVGGNVHGSILISGNQNTASLQYQSVELPPARSVDMAAELSALRQILSLVPSPDQNKIMNALGEAEAEATRQLPERDEVGRALDRALEYAKRAEGFAAIVEKLKPHVSRAVAWLGSGWHKILPAVGLVST